MAPLLALALAVLPAPEPAAPASSDADLAARAVAAALAAPGARAEVLAVRRSGGTDCAARRAEALRPVPASGEVALRLSGADAAGGPCEAWAWARVRVLAPCLSATRDVAAGEPLAGAVTAGEAEVTPGRPALAELPGSARAARALQAGAPIRPGDVRVGPAPGEPVTVRVVSGDLSLTVTGRAVACARGRACAVLPSGRRLEGRLAGDVLVVEAP